MRHKIDRQKKKTGDVVEIEIQINCTSTGLFQKTNKYMFDLCSFLFSFTYAVQVMMDQVENNLDVDEVVVMDKNVVEMT